LCRCDEELSRGDGRGARLDNAPVLFNVSAALYTPHQRQQSFSEGGGQDGSDDRTSGGGSGWDMNGGDSVGLYKLNPVGP
jgi:hypothetical protein